MIPINIIRLLLLVLLSTLVAANQSVANEEDSLVPGAESRQPFFSHMLQGKYNLLEDDFIDVPRRTTRFDYITEPMEELRPYSRPDAAEFAILNLQWQDGAIFINDFKTVTGQVKQLRGTPLRGKDKFLYRLFSGKQQMVYESYFEIPHRLYFDFLNEEDGELQGGSLLRTKTDFVLKIPLLDKSADRILFYRQSGEERTRARKSLLIDEQDINQDRHKIGETLF